MVKFSNNAMMQVQ